MPYAIVKFILATLGIFISLACGGGGGGSPSSGEVSIVDPKNGITENLESLPQEKVDFSYAMTEELIVTVGVTGINVDGPTCLIQVKSVSSGELTGDQIIRKGYLSADGEFRTELCLPSSDTEIEIIVHQAGMTTNESLAKLNSTSYFTEPSYRFKLDRENVDLKVEIDLIPLDYSLFTNSEKGRKKADLVDETLDVPPIVLQTVNTLLPEGVLPGAAYLDGRYNPNLPVIAPAEIDVTFIHEGAGYRNSFGYFIYTRNSSGNILISERRMIFPNASYRGSGGELLTGDTVRLKDENGNSRIFQPGENVGFFVIANGYNGSSVSGFDAETPIYPSTDPTVNRGPARGTMTTLDELNPEIADNRADVARHVAMIKVDGIDGFMDGEDFLIVGMEDIQRNKNSDNDFNDCVFIVRASPITAIATQEIISYNPDSPDSDLDGIDDANDNWPSDPSRAYTERTPNQGYWTLVFEDLYPTVGDADYNDLVVHYFHETVLNGFGEIKEFQGTYHFTARGSTLDHSFGMAFPTMEDIPAGTVRIERFHAESGRVNSIQRDTNQYGIQNSSGNLMMRVPVIDSTIDLLPGVQNGYANTSRYIPDQNAASARMVMVFSTPQKPDPFLAQNLDPFLWVNNGFAKIDIHLPGKDGFVDRPSHLPVESGLNSFLSDEGWPWAMQVPTDFLFPLEGVKIGSSDNLERRAYETFHLWASSEGELEKDWYVNPSEEHRNHIIRNAPQGRQRNWTIGR